jgi:carbon monoxide dehydrogenase subunit G
MIHVESKTSRVNASQEKVFAFLSDFRNISGMLPEDVMNNVVLEEEACRFELKGLGPAGLVIDEKRPFSLVKIKGTEETPADFTLLISINNVTEEESDVNFWLDARMNMFIEMIAKAPLQKFVDMMAEKVKLIK